MSHLILVRHGKSAWNHLGLWTGWTDIDLVEEGRSQARKAAEEIKHIAIHHAHISGLIRTRHTLDEIVKVLDLHHIPVRVSSALNERHYGIYTGKEDCLAKWATIKKIEALS